MTTAAERRATWIIVGITVAEGYWCAINFFPDPGAFVRYLGFAPDRAGRAAGWWLAAAVTVLYVGQSARLPSVREHLLRFSSLKALAFAMAVVAGILEEVFSRRLLMDAMAGAGFGATAQVLASGAAFGVAHGIWGLFGGSVRAAVGATVLTTGLGAALAVVYLLSGRSLAPCVTAHFLITFLIEPGLVLAAVRGEMSRATARFRHRPCD